MLKRILENKEKFTELYHNDISVVDIAKEFNLNHKTVYSYIKLWDLHRLSVLIGENEKQCCNCNEVKSLDNFYSSNHSKDGKRHQCKECHRLWAIENRKGWLQERKDRYRDKYYKPHRERNKDKINKKSRESAKVITKTGFTRAQNYSLSKFGLSPDDYIKMLEEQNNYCAICGKEETSIDPRYGRVKKLSVDHCHITGQVRGLLCIKCNSAIGHFDDTIELVEKALNYLKKYKEV